MSCHGDLYSVRMRASAGGPHEVGGRHVSGAERLVPFYQIAPTIDLLTRRATSAEGDADSIRISVDRVPAETITTIPALEVTTVTAATPDEARSVAAEILRVLAVPADIVEDAFRLLTNGPVLAGAILLDITDGTRCDPDNRGVRLSRLDYTPAARAFLDKALGSDEIPHHRTIDALAIATKAVWAGAIEICWSDAVDYTTGYIATNQYGYVRLPNFKPHGAAGGRILIGHWIRLGVEQSVVKLAQAPVLIDVPIVVNRPVNLDVFLHSDI